jgi:phage terminase large subunit-like protein
MTPLELKAVQELLYRKAAPTDLLKYTEYTHPSWVTSDHHVKLCVYLQALEALLECPYCRSIIEALGVFAPPRHSKTELVSRRFPSWCLGRHPEWHMICAQATGQLAFDTGADVRNIVNSPEFKHVFKARLRADAQAANRWITSKGGVYYAAGVDGAIVGRGANLLDIDDPHGGRAEADSLRMREVTGNWYFGDAVTRLMPPARQLLTLTRWHEDDLAGRLLPPKEEWLATEDPQFFCGGPNSDWHILRFRAIEHEDTPAATALWPGRYPLDWLLKRRDMLHHAGRGREWEAQYQQNPCAEEGTYLRRSWFEDRYDKLPEGCLFYIVTDFAVTDNRAKDPDRTELGVLALAPDDRVYVADWESYIATPDVWIDRLIDMIRRVNPMAVFGEKGVIKNAIEPALMRGMDDAHENAYFVWIQGMSDKLARGQSFRAWCSRKRVIFPKRAPWVDRAINELVSVGGGGRYWDKFDAMSTFFLAIDENHPAILRPDEKPAKKRDRWDNVHDIRQNRWKTG